MTAFLKQLYSASDLKEFYKKYWPSGDVASIKQVGDAKPGQGGIESMLDIEYSTGMAGEVVCRVAKNARNRTIIVHGCSRALVSSHSCVFLCLNLAGGAPLVVPAGGH